MRSRSPKDQLLYDLSEARTFEEWEETAFRLDELMSADIWYVFHMYLGTYLQKKRLLIKRHMWQAPEPHEQAL